MAPHPNPRLARRPGAEQQPWVQSQTTFAVLHREEDGSFAVRTVKQKIWVEGVSYELQVRQRCAVRQAARLQSATGALLPLSARGGGVSGRGAEREDGGGTLRGGVLEVQARQALGAQ